MTPPKLRKSVQAARADAMDALRQGLVLRYTGKHFENAATPGRGPTYSTDAVMRLIRTRQATFVSHETPVAEYAEIRVCQLRLTSEALAAS